MSERIDANEARYDRMAPAYRWVIRKKAGFVGAEPDDFPLALLEREIEDLEERRMQGGVYSLLTGRKPTYVSVPGAFACRAGRLGRRSPHSASAPRIG